jgi:Domain of unknown function (DUF4062)
MQTTLRVLKVFLASPNDVRPERAAAEALVNGINKQLNSALGWHIHLYKWEDAIPAYGRAQELINEAVDDCALFVGLLWERWGQPTGKYSSGFEEEYERALARRKKTDGPEIWLVFKTPNPDKVKDPGAELSRVLDFRKAVGAAREVFYKEVADLDDWRTKLQNWLWGNVVARANATTLSAQPKQPAPASETEPEDSSTGTGDVPKQPLRFLQGWEPLRSAPPKPENLPQGAHASRDFHISHLVKPLLPPRNPRTRFRFLSIRRLYVHCCIPNNILFAHCSPHNT